MKTRKSKQDIKNQINAILVKKRLTLDQLYHVKGNPQIAELITAINAEINAFSAVWDALNNNMALLNVYTSGKIE